MCLGADESLDLLLQRGIPVGDELVNQALDREAGIASPGVEVCSALAGRYHMAEERTYSRDSSCSDWRQQYQN